MKVTNNYGLPTAIVKAVQAQQDAYQSTHGKHSDISVTQLIDSPYKVGLNRKHKGELVEDASDRIWAMMGTAVHNLLEASEPKAKVEERLYHQFGDKVISGQFDRMSLSGKTLQDYKFCSVWEYIYGLKPERVQQLNVLRYLANKNGYNVDHLEVVMIFRDWQKSKTKHDANYPQTQVARVKVETWDDADTEAFIADRLYRHFGKDAEPCSPEERWATPDTWAVFKGKNKRAMRVLDSEGEAELYAHDKGLLDYRVEHRKGEDKRCNDYCEVREYCKYWRESNV